MFLETERGAGRHIEHGPESVERGPGLHVNGCGVFSDKRVFHHDYVPDCILHRDLQKQKISLFLSDMQRSARPRNVLCIGSFGTGKTAAVRHFCRDLNGGIASVYVNCSDVNTRLQIFREALQQLDSPMKPGFPYDSYLIAFKETVQKHSWVILVLDEVDKFVGRKDSEADPLFYTLSRSVPNVVTIMLTNRVDLEQKLQLVLDSRVRDTFRYELVEFPDYSASELMDILRARCRIGLRPGSYDEGIVAMVARKAYELGLRARGLLDMIRKAGEIAEARNQANITEDDVRIALKQLDKEHDMEIIRRLPPIQKTILAHILQSPGTSDTIYAWYSRELAPTLGIGPSRTRYKDHVNQLKTLGLLHEERHGLGRGRGQVVKLAVPADMTVVVTSSLESQDPPASTMGVLTATANTLASIDHHLTQRETRRVPEE
jgi:cell division control protein 6